MEHTILGRSGLKVSIAGLGCARASRLGQGTGHSEQESIAVVRLALDLGINRFDTSLRSCLVLSLRFAFETIFTLSRNLVIVVTGSAMKHPKNALAPRNFANSFLTPA